MLRAAMTATSVQRCVTSRYVDRLQLPLTTVTQVARGVESNCESRVEHSNCFKCLSTSSCVGTQKSPTHLHVFLSCDVTISTGVTSSVRCGIPGVFRDLKVSRTERVNEQCEVLLMFTSGKNLDYKVLTLIHKHCHCMRDVCAARNASALAIGMLSRARQTNNNLLLTRQ